MIKYIKYIFISFLCIILMSHNTFAADISINAVPIWSGIQPNFTCVYSNNSTTSNECVNTDNTNTRSISSVGFTLPAGMGIVAGRTVMQVELLFDNYLDNNSIDGNFTRAVLNGNGFGLIDVATSSQGATGYLVRMTFIAERTYTTASSDSYVIYNKFTSSEFAYLKPGERMFISAIGIYNIQGNGADAIVNAINNNNSSQAIEDAKDAIVDAIEDQNAKEDTAVDNINNQDPADIDTGDTSSATSIIGVMGSLFTTIKDTAATNCVIAGDLGHVDLGNLNLCQGKENFLGLFNFIGYSCLFVVVFWAAYHLVKRILALIDWYRSK